MIETCADLKLHPALFNAERRRNWWTPRDELEVSTITAWLDQVGHDCILCGKTMRKNGKPSEVPVLDYIVQPKDDGSSKLANLVVCCYKCSKPIE